MIKEVESGIEKLISNVVTEMFSSDRAERIKPRDWLDRGLLFSLIPH